MSLSATWVGDAPELIDRPSASRLIVSSQEIERVARQRGPGGSILAIHFQTMLRQLRVRYGSKIEFRSRQNDHACAAYRALELSDFAAINARQAWANWRTIPRSLNRQLSSQAVVAIDLCCGVGDSTEVLAYYCAPGSHILGLDMNATFVQAARLRRYWNRNLFPAAVRFREQSVLETFRNRDGSKVRDQSVDLVNASGAVGCHFDNEATEVLAREVSRVVRPGGLATIDTGREGTSAEVLVDLFQWHGFRLVQHARSCIWDRYVQLCLRKVE